MAGSDWGQGRPSAPHTTIFQVLLAYATQGGRLFAARRSADNPLTLTHVVWQGPAGLALEAARSPDADDLGSPEERDVWVQLALQVPSTPGRQMGPESPWLPLAVDQQQAMAWARMGRQSQTSWPPHGIAPGGSGGPGGPGVRGHTAPQPSPMGGWGSPAPSQAPSRPGSTSSPYSMPPHAGDASQWTGSMRRGETMEVVVLPCVEVELPPLMPGVTTAYRNDFSRDVAMHFGRAARTIQQIREVRGWMRGDRLVLAARFVVGTGNRTPTRPEMDAAARALAEVLAMRTLPYAALGFADPSEWVQGAPLPE